MKPPAWHRLFRPWWKMAIWAFLLLMVGGGMGVIFYFSKPPTLTPTKQSAQEQQQLVTAALELQKMRSVSEAGTRLSVPLEEMLNQNDVRTAMIDIPFENQKIRFTLLTPGPVLKPVLIEPGWNIYSGPDGCEFVTYRSSYLPTGENPTADIPVLQLKPSTPANGKYQIRKLPPNSPLNTLLRTLAADESIPWNIAQTALWIQHLNISLDQLRKERYSAFPGAQGNQMLGASYPVAPTVETIDRALTLLEKFGAKSTSFQIFEDTEKSLAIASEEYRNSQADVQNLETIGFYRTRPEARAILAEVFSRYPGNDGIPLRKTAFRHLKEVVLKQDVNDVAVHQNILEILTEATAREKDVWLKQDMEKDLEQVKQAVAKMLF